ncbi:MAG: hypothetical protein FWF03_00705, partial [Defluviitaleaceae bacterium]|nr:hypothetical protein [Defluviitaleaceae bacterium]
MKLILIFLFSAAAFFFTACGSGGGGGGTARYAEGRDFGPWIEWLELLGGPGAVESSERGVWGGHQPMVASTETAVYAAYFSRDVSFNSVNFFSRRGGEWRKIEFEGANRVNEFDMPHSVMTLASGGKVYVLTPKNSGRLWIWEYDEETETSERYESIFTGGYYISAAIDAARQKIYAILCFGSKPGSFVAVTFDIATKTFTKPETVLTEYRYCYPYVLPNASGFMVIAGRDTEYYT